MKRILLLLAVMGLIVSSYAQNPAPIDVPTKISKTFEKSHPKISDANWTQVGDNYKACYMVDDKKMGVSYNPAGKVIETEKQVSLTQLPTSVLKYVNDNYPGAVLNKMSMVTDAKGKSWYKVQANQQDLAFNSQGKFLQPETK